MKSKLVLLLIVACFVCGVSSGESYQIRLTYNTNLRATASLSGTLIETAPAGAMLQVVGSGGRWLRIDRNGHLVWMADWVSFTRVEANGQPQSQQPIDNCCFVDRQCQSDDEWTSGYRAFQNRECAAPAQSQPQESTPVSTVSSSQIDNCCFIDRQCRTDQEWRDGYWAFQNNHCNAPAQTPAIGSPRPVIEGADDFVRRVNRVLDLLEHSAPAWYTYVNQGINRIVEHSQFDRSYVYADRGILHLARYHAFRGNYRSDLFRTALVLVHEACHAHRYAAGLASGGEEGESDCMRKEIDLIETVDPYGRLSALNEWKRYLQILLSRIDDPRIQWWN